MHAREHERKPVPCTRARSSVADATSVRNAAAVRKTESPKAHSVGHNRQLLNLIGYAIMVNSLALLEASQRAGPMLAA